MKKNYEVTVTRVATACITGAESEQEARDFAEIHVKPDDFRENQIEVIGELDDHQVDSFRHHEWPIYAAEL